MGPDSDSQCFEREDEGGGWKTTDVRSVRRVLESSSVELPTLVAHPSQEWISRGAGSGRDEDGGQDP